MCVFVCVWGAFVLVLYFHLIYVTSANSKTKKKQKTYGYKDLYTTDSKRIIYSSFVTTALRLVHKADMVSRPKAAKSLHSTVTGKCKPRTEVSRIRTATYKNTE